MYQAAVTDLVSRNGVEGKGRISKSTKRGGDQSITFPPFRFFVRG